jgi:hypothetical protein
MSPDAGRAARRRVTYVPSVLALRQSFVPYYAQLEIGAVGASSPEWPEGTESVVRTADKIAVATRPDSEGDVLVEVWMDDDGSAPSGVLVHDGFINLPDAELEVGTSVGADLVRIHVGQERCRVQVLADEPARASTRIFLVDAVLA